MDYEAKINFLLNFHTNSVPCCQQKHKGHEFTVAFSSLKVVTCLYWMGLFAVRPCHSHLVSTEPWGCDISWNILWFLSALKGSAPSQPAHCWSEGNQPCQGQKVTNQQPSDSHHSAAARCSSCFSGQLKKQGRGREKGTEKDRQLRRGETRNAMSQRHLSAQMKWKQQKGNTALLFSKLYFQLNELKRKYPFLFLRFWEICLLSLQA